MLFAAFYILLVQVFSFSSKAGSLELFKSAVYEWEVKDAEKLIKQETPGLDDSEVNHDARRLITLINFGVYLKRKGL